MTPRVDRPGSSSLRRWLFACLGLTLGSCDCGPELQPDGPSVDAIVGSVEAEAKVEVDGCATMRAGVGCVRPTPGLPTKCERTRSQGAVDPSAPMALVVWSDRAGVLELDGVAVDARSTEVRGGHRWRVDVPGHASTVTLRCAAVGPPCWSLRLAPPDVEPPIVFEARSLRGEPRGPTAVQRLRDRVRALEVALPGLEPAARMSALDVITDVRLGLAGTEPSLEARRAAYRAALERTAQAYALARSRGEPGRASCHARRGVRYALDGLGELATAHQWRAKIESLTDVPGPAVAQNRYYEGLLAQREGDLKAARAAYLAAEQGSDRLADWPMQRASLTQAAIVLASLGLEGEVEALFERLRAERGRFSCLQWARVLNNLGWARFVLGQLGRPVPDPVPEFDEALLLMSLDDDQDACHDPDLEEHVRLNLGLVTAEQGWTQEAARLLASLPAQADSAVAGNRFWYTLLEQRLVLARGNRGELVELVMREPPPHGGAPPEQRWLSQRGRGEAFEVLGLPQDAVAAYRDAERALDTLMLALDFDSERDRLLRGRQLSAGRLVALLAAKPDPAAALCAARRARRRTHDALDRPARIAALTEHERERWTAAVFEVQRMRSELDTLHGQTWSLAGDELSAHHARLEHQQRRLDEGSALARGILYGGSPVQPRPQGCTGWSAVADGQLMLLYFPIDEDERRWQGFAVDARGVRATATLDPPAANAPLSAWSAALLEPFAEPLAAAQGVVVLPTGRLWTVPFAALPWRGDVLLAHAPVAISLDLAGRAAPTDPPGRTALVVADPRGDLPAARREATVVTHALDTRGWSIETLVGRQARSSEVQARLPQVDLLHYAGHGRHEGTEGWGSGLRLAAAGSLQVRDVLALPRVPPVVMLPACDTASTAPATLGGGMSIARAFLLAGADLVVASQDLLDDAFAAALAEQLYAQGPVTPAQGPAALQRAVLAARDRFPADVWHPVVALVP